MATREVTIIGRGARVRGRITGTATLEILGLVDGEILVDGDLTVGDSGMVASDLSGRRVVVRGAVKGNVTGEESVHLEDGAKVVGDVKAPRIAIAAGALVRGHVQTAGSGGAARPRAATKPAGVSAPRPVAAASPVKRAPVAAAKPAAVPAARGSAPRGATLAGMNHTTPAAAPPPKKGPPPPIVPALKKGAKGALAKKR
jgi:cytoskeletal protein CcmA (bactofilin family)